MGQRAPDFQLHDADMRPVRLSSYRGRHHVVLFFYARDGMPACTLEAAEYSDREAQFRRHGCVILGVSRDDCLTHAEFRDRHGLSIVLLSDPDGSACRAYGVLREEEREGRRREYVVRSTFVIDRKGVVRHAAYGVHPRQHVAEIYEIVRRLRG